MPSPTELARDALQKSEVLEHSVALLKERLDRLDAAQLRERLVVLESRLAELEKAIEQLKPTKAEAEEMGAVKSRLAQLEKREEDAGKRGWQFVFIAAGAGLALLSSFLVQLVFYFIKK